MVLARVEIGVIFGVVFGVEFGHGVGRLMDRKVVEWVRKSAEECGSFGSREVEKAVANGAFLNVQSDPGTVKRAKDQEHNAVVGGWNEEEK